MTFHRAIGANANREAAQRRREIGIRRPFRAQTAQNGRMVVWQGIELVAAGIAIGFLVSLMLARFSSTLLFGISPGNAPTMALVAAGVGCLAAVFHARDAARVDPVRVLQSE